MLSEIYLGNLSHVNTRHWEQSLRAVYLLQKSCGCRLGVTRNRKVQCMAKREGKVSKLPNEGFLHRLGGVAAFSQFPNCSNQPFSGTSAPAVARTPLEQQELRVFYAELSRDALAQLETCPPQHQHQNFTPGPCLLFQQPLWEAKEPLEKPAAHIPQEASCTLHTEALRPAIGPESDHSRQNKKRDLCLLI